MRKLSAGVKKVWRSARSRLQPAPNFVGRWVWLFPLTYLAHIAEEYFAGEGFPAWLSRVAGVVLTPDRFLLLNAAFWLAMAGMAALATARPRAALLVVALGVLVLINTLLHVGGTLGSGSYSPGLVSAALLWLPLGLFALRWSWRRIPPSHFALGAALGIMGHGLVSLLALRVDLWLGL